MKEGAEGGSERMRREFLLGSAALFLGACSALSQVRATHALIETPHPDVWHPILRSLIVSVLPFEHPAFPRVTPDDLFAELNRLFPIERDPAFKTLPKALVLFDDCPLFETPPAPFVDDERQSLAQSRLPEHAIDPAIEVARLHDRSAWASHARRFGSARFTAQRLEAQRAYLSLWARSEFVTRRRFYRGAKALVTITAYSTAPFWETVGYDGPILAS